MAQITKQQLLEISEEFEKVYQDMIDELLINIAKHFNDPNNQRTMFWEIQKLSELGAITEESAEIIAKRSGVIPELIESKFWEVAKEANIDINPQLREALEKGVLSGTFHDMESSPAIRSLLEEYINQAKDKMNLTNTTMLESTLRAYSQVIQDITFYENQMKNAQSILNIASGMLTTNQKTRQDAFKWALDKMADEGITGFVDRIGRNWSAESYVAMVVRTTAHNVAINSVKERMSEYNSDIFQVSSHSGCRPSHYKFQDKFYSWKSPAGSFKDGLGHKHKYENITDVSADDKYGSVYPSAGGIFGVNCSHYPIPIIPNLSIPRERTEQSKEENDKEYALSQQQRALERRIREQKRAYEIDKASGMPEEVLKKDAEAIRESQKQMRQFIKETGRARRYDREGISRGIAGNIANITTPSDTFETYSNYYPKTIAGVKRGRPMTFEEANTGRVNPKFLEDSGARVNCQTCVVDMEARLRGYDVEARLINDKTASKVMDMLAVDSRLAWGNGSDAQFLIDTWGRKDTYTIGYLRQREAMTAKKLMKYFENELIDGERYTFSFPWSGRNNGAHIVMLFKEQGEVFIYDPQSSRKIVGKDGIETYLSLIKYRMQFHGVSLPSSIQLMRIDDKDFNTSVVDVILKPAGENK